MTQYIVALPPFHEPLTSQQRTQGRAVVSIRTIVSPRYLRKSSAIGSAFGLDLVAVGLMLGLELEVRVGGTQEHLAVDVSVHMIVTLP